MWELLDSPNPAPIAYGDADTPAEALAAALARCESLHAAAVESGYAD